MASRAIALVAPGVAPRRLKAEVDVQRDGPHWVVQLQTQSGAQTGRRTLRAESCKALEDAVALLLAMTMEARADGVLEVPPASPPTVPPPPAAAPDPTSPTPPPVPPPVRRARPARGPTPTDPGPRLGAFVRAGGKAGLAQQPGLALGASGAAGMRLGRLDLGVTGTYWPTTAHGIDAVDGARLLVRRQNVGLHACFDAWRAGSLVAAPCVSPGLTFFQFKSEGLLSNRSGSAGPLPSLAASASLRYELLGEALSVALGAGLTWERRQPFERSVVAEDPDMDGNVEGIPPVEVYTTKALGPWLELGIDARF